MVDWNSKKVFIDTKLWYIENFLSLEEIEYLMTYANEPTGWYSTMRSDSIKNKFIGIHVDLDENGDAIFPGPDSVIIPEQVTIFTKKGGVYDRLKSVFPGVSPENATLQSFFATDKDDHGGAYNWHSEKGDDGEWHPGLLESFSIYLNEDFEGGVLEFKGKPYKIYPKAGMLISIPITSDFTHRVTPVRKGARHTLYGNFWEDVINRSVSTAESC